MRIKDGEGEEDDNEWTVKDVEDESLPVHVHHSAVRICHVCTMQDGHHIK